MANRQVQVDNKPNIKSLKHKFQILAKERNVGFDTLRNIAWINGSQGRNV